MLYFYHGVQEKFEGDELISLNEMMKVNPELHEKYSKKYEGRKNIVQRKIPILDCTWEDVVQMLPMNPTKLFELQKELGLIDEIPDYKFFRIDPRTLDEDKAVVYFKSAPGEENSEIKSLKDVNLDEIQDVPPATRKYYESMVGKDEPVFNYQFVPHVLYKGRVKVALSDTVELNN